MKPKRFCFGAALAVRPAAVPQATSTRAAKPAAASPANARRKAAPKAKTVPTFARLLADPYAGLPARAGHKRRAVASPAKTGATLPPELAAVQARLIAHQNSRKGR